MRKWLFCVLIGLGTVILLLFIKEGKQDSQSLNPVTDVSNKTVRDIAETVTSPIEVPVAKEIEIGRRVLAHFATRPAGHPQVEYVNEIGTRLASLALRKKEITYTFHVMPDSMVNAFALPGGFVLVTSGMIEMADESELAWVIAHEISHVEHRHALTRLRLEIAKQKLSLAATPLENLANLAQTLAQLAYSETMEMEADRSGIRLVMEGDYDPKAALHLISVMQGRSEQRPAKSRNPFFVGVQISTAAIKSYFGTHPAWEQRRQIIAEEIQRRGK